jgi:hypothetical protein
MSPGAARIFNVLVFLSIVLGLTLLVAAGWIARSESPNVLFAFALPVGNKELVGFRERIDFRVASVEPPPVFVMWTRAATARERAAVDEAWGRPKHWLRIPEFNLSLWWPIMLSLVLPATWVMRRRRHSPAGFPVAPAEGRNTQPMQRTATAGTVGVEWDKTGT